MKRSKFSEVLIMFALRRSDTGTPVVDAYGAESSAPAPLGVEGPEPNCLSDAGELSSECRYLFENR